MINAMDFFSTSQVQLYGLWCQLREQLVCLTATLETGTGTTPQLMATAQPGARDGAVQEIRAEL